MTFEPLPPLRRNVRMPREQPRRWPLVLGTASMVVLCVSVLMLRASAPARVVRAAPPPPTVPPQVRVVAVSEPPDPPRAVRGTALSSLVPSSMRETLTDDQAAELLALVNEWLADEDSFGTRPSIELRRGVVYVESEEDRGDDPPYPLAVAPEAELVCGSAATWIRAFARDRLRHAALTCANNVCTYSGAEYSPSGIVVFHHGDKDADSEWSLAAWAEYYNAGLAPTIARANTEHVAKSMRRLAGTRCQGEPNRHD